MNERPSTGGMSQQLPSTDTIEKRHASRSPHPYHRRSLSIIQNRASVPAGGIVQDENSGSSTERGTEADDEKGAILRSLPAPPLKHRKGWKGSKSSFDLTPTISPFPSPRISGADRISYFSTEGSKDQSSSKRQTDVQKVDAELYRKYSARRRAELVRRATEICLLGLIGYLVSDHDAAGEEESPGYSNEIFTAAVVVATLCASYPLQLVYRGVRHGFSMRSALRYSFHIPSRFDLGALLYPTLIPLYVAMSLRKSQKDIVLANLILGLASLPQRIIPLSSTQASSVLHWILCMVILDRGKLVARNHKLGDTIEGLSVHSQAEGLTLLYPMHLTLVAIIKFVTATSLDPAELQLLSAGLANVLLFSTSPQTQILRSVIWVGALCIFVLCQAPLRWEVMLARIPAWKFARNKPPTGPVFSKVEAFLSLIFPTSRNRFAIQHDSDDEDYEHLRLARERAKTRVKSNAVRKNSLPSTYNHVDPSSEANHKDNFVSGLTRSATLPARQNSSKPRGRAFSSSKLGILSLTFTQAQAFKWLVAAYVYTCVVLIIMLVVRPYIGNHALASREPIGWAIGYFLGNISSFRLFVVSNNLERWIALPEYHSASSSFFISGWVEQSRQKYGPANVRLFLAAYCIVVLSVGLALVTKLKAIVEVDTRRKVFHGIMVAMLLPTIAIDPCFVSLALIVILAIFLLLDLFRASQLPPISRPLTTFLAPYVDGRDYRGPVIISHIFLLIGCAIPLWLALAAAPRSGQNPWTGWEVQTRDLSMVSGVICVGMGDAAASLIGRRYGRTKWFWGGGKSLEGSAAFAVAVTAGLMACYVWFRIGGWLEWDLYALPQATLKAAIAASGASLLESVLTAANDNVVVPIGLWLLVRGLHI